MHQKTATMTSSGYFFSFWICLQLATLPFFYLISQGLKNLDRIQTKTKISSICLSLLNPDIQVFTFEDDMLCILVDVIKATCSSFSFTLRCIYFSSVFKMCIHTSSYFIFIIIYYFFLILFTFQVINKCGRYDIAPILLIQFYKVISKTYIEVKKTCLYLDK